MEKNGKPSKQPQGWLESGSLWLDKDANRDKLKMAGTALAVVIGASFTVFKLYVPPPRPTLSPLSPPNLKMFPSRLPK